MILERGALLHKRYRIVEILGQGGMGSVYRAVDENLGVDIAIKENLFTSDEYSRQFRLEAVILANLRHPNLPRVFDHFVVGNQGQYLVMDYIEGEDLRQRMERIGVINEDEAVYIGAAMCDALGYLHSRKPPILHRDLKPGNVKITPDGHMFLVDFGLAKVVQGTQATTTGARAMTPGYSPPEQYGTARTDPRTDIYSLGATLYAALCGVIPEDGLARAMDNAQLTPLRKRNPNISKRLAVVVEKAMDVDPEERYQTAEDFQKALLASKSKTQQLTGSYTVDPPPHVEEGVPSSDKPKARTITGGPPYPPEDNGEDKPFKPSRKKKKSGGCLPRMLLVVLIALAMYLTWSFVPGMQGQVDAWMTSMRGINVMQVVSDILPAKGEPASTTTPTSQPTQTLHPTATATLTVTKAPTLTLTIPPTPLGGGYGQFAFASDRSGVPQIYLAKADGSDPVALTNMPDGACQPTWSPDGMQLVFTSPCTSPEDTFENSSLYVIYVDGTGLSPLFFEPGGDHDPAWSSDGRRIVFTSRRYGRPSIFVLDFASSEITLLFEATGNFMEVGNPVWSPTNNQILFVANRGISEIWAMTDTGKNPIQLVYSGMDFMDFDPVWSPDGQMVRFSQRLLGPSGVWLAELVYEERELMSAKRLPLIPPWIEDIQYSQDGQWLIYEGLVDNNRDIYYMSPDGEFVTRLTTDPGVDFDPTWRPMHVP